MSLYTIKAVLVLESDGKRLVAKYFVPRDHDLANLKNQEAFEAKLFKKSVRQHGNILHLTNISKFLAEVVSFDGYTAVYKSRSDVTFYVVGSADENELLLLTALNSFRDSLDILLTCVLFF